MTENRPTAIYWVWGLVIFLIILHQDNWLWHNDYAVFGFIPIGLFFHACISVAASITWFLATKYAWPHELDNIEPMNTDDDAAPISKAGGAAE